MQYSKDVLELINNTKREDSKFNEECFSKWVEERNIDKLRYPNDYIIRNFGYELDKGTFYKKEKVINLMLLHKRLKDLGFKSSTTNHFLLELIINHCINEFPITENDMQKAINDILYDCQDKSYKAFISKLVSHPLIENKANIPLSSLVELAKRQAKEWDTAVKELEQSENDISVEEALRRG